MARFGSRFVQGVALLLIALAVPIVLWLPQMRLDKGPRGRIGSSGLPISYGLDASDDQITYRFLCRGETGAIQDRLTLERFVSGDLQEGATWGFVNSEQWYNWAPAIFDREKGWVAENQPGWQISGWLAASVSDASNKHRLFWAIQALRLLDPESFVNQIDMLEASGCAVRICRTDGPSDYDYDADTLYWNPAETALVPRETSLDWKWFRTDPLVTLAHELGHAWHDLCRRGDAASLKEREQVAIVTENRIRHIVFLKDPACAHLYPRPGYQETWPDLPGASAAEAWWHYRGAMRY